MALRRVQEADFNQRGFWALIATQFQGAFNDNLYKWVIQFFLIALLSRAGAATRSGGVIFEWVGGVFSGLGLHFSQNQKGDIDLAVAQFHLTAVPQDYIPAMATFLFSLPFIIFPSLFGA
ncbi:MAG: hypothetical protein HYV26_04880, partial [Candidatus Hydrogenedentes bacterium]|nr:hypothetical protein [Candidatus Hydrogenedentota bacterium]